MECIRCHVDMATTAQGPVQLDSCPECEAVWFDHGELAKLRKVKSGTRRETPTIFVPLNEGAGIPCPGCHERDLELFQAHGFRVERCTRCGGVFLDGEEVEHLLRHWRSKRRTNRRRRKAAEKERRSQAVVAAMGAIIAGL